MIRKRKTFLTEGRAEFKAKFGEDRLNRFLAIKNKIPNDQQKYKDMDYITARTTPEQLDKMLDYYDSYVTPTQKKKQDLERKKQLAQGGYEFIGERNGWRVYYIKTYEASNYYGRGTKWCVSGDNVYADGKHPRDHFAEYLQYGRLYFYLKGTQKIAVFIYDRVKTGKVEIYDDADRIMYFNDLPEDFPDMSDLIEGAPCGYIPMSEECAMASFDTFAQGGDIYAFDPRWFRTGQIDRSDSFMSCLNFFLDNGYELQQEGHGFVVLVPHGLRYGRPITLDDFIEMTEFDPQSSRQLYPNEAEGFRDENGHRVAQTNPLIRYYQKSDDMYIFMDNANVELTDEQMDAIEDLLDQGYKFYDARENDFGFVLTRNEEISEKFDEISYTQFIREL